MAHAQETEHPTLSSDFVLARVNRRIEALQTWAQQQSTLWPPRKREAISQFIQQYQRQAAEAITRVQDIQARWQELTKQSPEPTDTAACLAYEERKLGLLETLLVLLTTIESRHDEIQSLMTQDVLAA